MRLLQVRRSREDQLPGVCGAARLDRRTANLTNRLRPGEIAVVHHLDLDRASAEALVGARVAAVVNTAPSVSGRYPNLGPEIIAAAGIPLLDVSGRDVFAVLDEGDLVRVHESRLFRGEHLIADGELLDHARVTQRLESARGGLEARLEAFTFTAVEHLRHDQALLLDGAGVPHLRTPLAGRQVLLVVRSYDYRADLRALKPYIRGNRPVLIGVDGGADVLAAAGYVPDLIVGDLDIVSDTTLRLGAELVSRGAYAGSVGGDRRERLERLGLDAAVFDVTGTSEDAAMLLADISGASLIVTAGSHVSLDDFLDRGQSAMASAFLTRLRVGPRLVDAKTVARLHHNRVRGWQLVLLFLAGLSALLLAVAITPTGAHWLGLGSDIVADLVAIAQESFP